MRLAELRRGVLALLAMLSSVPPVGATVAVDLQLALAVDVSGSVDPEEAQLQRRGYVAAFRHPEIIQAIQSGQAGRIAVLYVEWASVEDQRVVADWTLIEDAPSAQAFADRLAEAPIQIGVQTSISGAIRFVLPRFADDRFKGARRVIDISGDGPNNNGLSIDVARAAALDEGVTINGLPILNERLNRYGFPGLDDLDLYYEGCVIGGPGAFMVVARSFADFAGAIRRKLLLEIAGLAPDEDRGGPAPAASVYAKGCDIGERQAREFWRQRRLSPD